MKFLAFSIFLSSLPVLACEVKGPGSMSLAVSTAEEKIFSYGAKVIQESIPSTTLTNCKEAASRKRFLMITMGPEIVSGTDGIRGVNFDQRFPEKTTCRLRNTEQARANTTGSQREVFFNKWSYIKSCVEIKITESGRRPLQLPSTQPGCTLTRLSEKSVSFNGGYCFFTPSADSNLTVSVDVREDCKKLEGLRRLGVSLQDFEAGLNFYTSSSAKDEVNDLINIGNVPIRISTNPVRELFPVSDDFGILRPTFPADYPVNDLDLGKIQFLNVSDTHLVLKSPFVVKNQCPMIFSLGLTSSTCSYAIPVIAELSLINSRGEKEFTWFDGGIAPSNWTGIINGEGYQIAKDSLRPGERYSIQAVFSDPYHDYRSFKRWVQNRIQSFYRSLPSYIDPEGISSIPVIKEVEEINQMLEVSQIKDVNFQSGINDLTSVRKRLGSYFSTTHYPPMYDRICNPQSSKCAPVGKPFVKLTASFTLDFQFNLKDIEHERSSILLRGYKKKVITPPEYSCE